MKIVTIYNIKKNDPGVLFALRYGNLMKSINVHFVTLILCQLNSLSQKKDHLNKTTLIFKELHDYCLYAIYIKLSPERTNRQGF